MSRKLNMRSQQKADKSKFDEDVEPEPARRPKQLPMKHDDDWTDSEMSQSQSFSSPSFDSKINLGKNVTPRSLTSHLPRVKTTFVDPANPFPAQEDEKEFSDLEDEDISDSLSDESGSSSVDSENEEVGRRNDVEQEKGRFSPPFYTDGDHQVGVLYIDDDPLIPPELNYKEVCRLCDFEREFARHIPERRDVNDGDTWGVLYKIFKPKASASVFNLIKKRQAEEDANNPMIKKKKKHQTQGEGKEEGEVDTARIITEPLCWYPPSEMHAFHVRCIRAYVYINQSKFQTEPMCPICERWIPPQSSGSEPSELTEESGQEKGNDIAELIDKGKPVLANVKGGAASVKQFYQCVMHIIEAQNLKLDPLKFGDVTEINPVIEITSDRFFEGALTIEPKLGMVLIIQHFVFLSHIQYVRLTYSCV
jgi:hypothetical protein